MKTRKNVKFKLISVILILILLFVMYGSILTINFSNAAQTTGAWTELNESKYPGYKTLIQNLIKNHPNWNFTIFYTGLNWSDVIYNEASVNHSRSLVQCKTGEWICETCAGTVHDGSNWIGASTKAVKYIMDPRNWLNDNYVFQFETLSYVSNVHTLAGVEKILLGTFMANTNIRTYYANNNYENITFAQAILNAGIATNVSPYHLASRIRQEIGATPSGSVSGKVSGYEGYFNFYNIQATPPNAVTNGLIYAKSKSWNTPAKSISGGASWICDGYINKNQNTLYLQKYDVETSYTGTYWHQYMTNIEAAKNEGAKVYNAYLDLGIIDNNYNFVIPVYENMPATACEAPSNLQYVNQKVKVITTTTGLSLRANPSTSATVIRELAIGEFVTRTQIGAAYINGEYWDKVKDSKGNEGYVASKYLEFVEKLGDVVIDTNDDISQDDTNKIITTEPNTKLKKIKEKNTGKTITGKDKNGTALTDDSLVGTGSIITINSVNYTVIKFGDVNGDGKVLAIDALKILKHSTGIETLSGNYLKAADTNKDTKILATDALLALKVSTGLANISI